IHRHRVLPQKEVYDHKVRSGSNFISQSVKKRSRSCPGIIPKLLGKIVVSIKFLKLTINELAYDVTTKNMNPYK
ncbi:hypothetical protein L2734_15590, partial [Parashewanella spongiae]